MFLYFFNSTISLRKYPSGNDKRKKKKRIDNLVESQRGTLHKFLKSNTSPSRDLDTLAIVVVEEPANALRSTVSQERLNGLATLCIEKRLLDEIDIETIIDDFASRNIRRNF